MGSVGFDDGFNLFINNLFKTDSSPNSVFNAPINSVLNTPITGHYSDRPQDKPTVQFVPEPQEEPFSEKTQEETFSGEPADIPEDIREEATHLFNDMFTEKDPKNMVTVRSADMFPNDDAICDAIFKSTGMRMLPLKKEVTMSKDTHAWMKRIMSSLQRPSSTS